MSKKTALTPGAARKASILETGANLAAKHGAVNVTRRMVAREANISEALVSRYMGDTATAQKAYRRKAKSMGLTEPSKAEQEAIGVELRAHGPRSKPVTRKRSQREVKAIQRKVATPKVPVTTKQQKSLPTGKRSSPAAAKRETKPAPAKRETKPRFKTKAPPPNAEAEAKIAPPLANTFP